MLTIFAKWCTILNILSLLVRFTNYMISVEEKKHFIDFIRGIAIFLMLWGHSVQYCCGGQFDFFENTIFTIIYSFHMPFFMLISGYLFFFSSQKRQFTDLIEYKTKSIIYPILMCSILNLLLTNGVSFVFLGWGLDTILGKTTLTSLWFLWSVLSCSFALSIAVRIFKNPIIQAFLIVLGIAIVAIFPCWEFNIWMYPYFVIGYFYARNEMKLKDKFCIVSSLSTVVFVIMLFFFEKEHYIYTSGLFGRGKIIDALKIDSFRWAIGLLGSIAIISLCKVIFRTIYNTKTANFIKMLGENSLAAYALSVSLLSFWLPIFANKALELLPKINWNNHILLYNLIITPLIAILYSILLIGIIKIMKKNKCYRVIFGR